METMAIQIGTGKEKELCTIQKEKENTRTMDTT